MSKTAKQQAFPAHKFTNATGANANQVFLLTNYDSSPYLRPVSGWEIIGYGKAPWPGSSDGFAVLFERVEPGDWDTANSAPEGTQIWQHMRENDYKRYIHYTT